MAVDKAHVRSKKAKASAAAPAGLRANGRGRREPVQERSRRTVARLLQAADAIVGEQGVEAATTRAIAERAGVTPPSLYRFFDDRDAILDALLEAMLGDLEAAAKVAEGSFAGDSIEEFVRLEFDLHVGFYERHPSLVPLWFGGRVSAPVVELVRARNRHLAQRARHALVEAGLVDSATPHVVFELLVECGDRTVEVAFRDGPWADTRVIDAGISGLTGFLGRWVPTGRPIAHARNKSQEEK